MDLTGVALITGAASGIGKATALLFVAEGCRRLVLADVNREGLEKSKEEIAADQPDVVVLAVQTDLRSEDSVDNCVEQAIVKFGRIDYCCNIAGITLGGITTEVKTSDFDLQYEVDLRGVFFCERAQLRAMLKQEPVKPKHSEHPVKGVIVNVSSMAGLFPYPGLPSYAAFKHGVCGLTKSDAMEYGPKGIRINAVCPGGVKTNINRTLSAEYQEKIKGAQNIVALRRFAEPKEIAEAIAWLCSGRSSYVCGSTISINGGREGAS
ncbi:uncharacterized protein A1O9_12851 [Exophiala aquamarina CBS 119918]|uniref:3-oxoacyl-[acyl-carrier protein] reductase n=1 Tax=Exophiala aquamarina CBS 119918 TaxID=1182545 RepID=A0A072NVR7_9EURO|nr:uncharacterized protein A1O9_12851 [Exophiala aquamarina CBS 119918]KEF51128.1 hypothetical protein A1O9_12851 [Exophiala aquamarina CBS 119918]